MSFNILLILYLVLNEVTIAAKIKLIYKTSPCICPACACVSGEGEKKEEEEEVNWGHKGLQFQGCGCSALG